MLIALLCVPWVTQAQCPDNEVGCPITISGTDDYGDGWNDASISVYQGTTLRGSFTLSSGDSYTASINICTGDSVRLVWNEGDFDDECSFTVLNGDGTTVITGVWGDSYTQGQTIITFEPACPTCPQPSNLAAALTSNGIEVSWVANGTESSWLVYVNGEYEATVTSEEYTITSPTEGSVYSITVAAYCGVGDTSIFIGPISLTIPGAAITDYPYSTGFETDDDAGWSFENSTTNAWYVGSATNNGGTNSMYISNNNGTANAYNTSSISMSYAYRAFTVDDAYDMAVSFDWKCNGESNYDYIRAWIAPATAQFTAGQLPDGSTSAYNYTSTTPAGWIDLNPGTGKLNLSSNWQTKVSTFHVNAGTYYLVFMWANDGSGGSTPPGAIDNVILTQLTCAQPLDLGVDALQTSADFFWTPAGDESNWEVMFDNNNYYVTDTFYSATNLTVNTPYTIAVRAICGEGDTSFWSTYSFRTPCDFIDTLPYINDFESASTGSSTSFEFGAPCWTLNTDATQYPYVYISSSTTYNHTPNGGKGIYWYRSSSTGTYGSYQCLVLPGVDTDVLPLNTLQLKFWAKASTDSYSPVFQVGVMTDPGNIATFTPINTVNVQGTTWTEYETFFAGYEGTGRYMAIRANYDASYWYAYVDDVTIDLIPSCPHVASISVDSVSTEYLGISWVPSGEENEWIVYLNDSIIGNAVSTPEYEITDLALNTIYTIGIRALCDGGDTSAIWTINGRTSAGDPISTFPYYCDFETDDDNNTHANDWILENGSQTNYWTIGTAASNSPSHSMYITDNGTANSYNGSSTSNVFAYAVFNFDTGEYAFSFDWKGVAESCCDYLRVALVPDASDLVAGASGFPGGSTTFGSNRNQNADWVNETNIFSITTPGLYKLVFNWHNDGSVGNNPPAAVDNIMVVRNTCPMPTNVHATYITGDSITIAWTPGGSETSWVVSDGINTYEVQSPDNAGFTFDQLSPSTLYHFTIQAVCADDDSSLYASVNVRTACGAITSLPLFEDFESVGTTSSSNNNFIPCWTKVCNATSSYYPYVSQSTTYNHTPGGAYGIYWYRSSTAGSYGDYNILVLPQLDTTALPLNTTMLTFWAKNSSTSYHPVIYVGTMQHPDSVSSFQTYAVFNDFSTDWTKYTVIFDNYEDTIGASYIAIRSNYTGDYWYLYVDDIRLDSIPDCSPVEDLVVEGGVTSAMVHWNSVGNSYTGATVRYKETGSSNWNTMTVTGQNYAVLTGLTPDTTYDVSVGSICGEDIASSVSATFETGSFPCGQFDSSALINVTVGQGATTNTYFPSYSLYNYGYSQQFYTAHEIGGAGVITSLTLYPSAITQQRTYEIYMGTYADSSSSTYVTPTGLTCVYNGGHIPLTAGQPVTFNLTTPFNYNGVSNLVVIFRDLTGSYVSGNAWYGDVAWSNVGQMNYQDGGAYSVPQSGTGVGSHASVNDFRNKITFFGGTCLQASTCAAPIPHVSSIGTTTVDLVWAPGNVETSWRLYYRQVGAANFTQAGTATTNSYQFTGLASGTNYEFMVVPVCADSISATTHATTECAVISNLPYSENFNSWGSGSGVIPNCWYRTGSYSSYTYISSSYNHSGNGGGSIYMYQSGTNHSAIFMPALDTTVYHPNQTQLVFHAMNYSASYMNPGFEVGVLSDPSDISTFVPVDTVYHTADINVWEIFEVPLANYTGDGAYVGLRTINNPYSTAQYTYTYFYMDDFTLELIPTCPRPDSLTATNATTNSVDLGWHERGNASNWIIEYGPIGFTPGTGTIVAANSNPFTLNGLPAAYQGEYYVKSVCSSTDTGEYSRMACAFGTSQIPATIPYNYDFESSTEFDNWQTCSNSTINWYRGTAVAHNSNYSMYVSADQGATYKPYTNSSVVNTAIYRDIDFGSIDSSFTISFDARVGGTLTASYDGLMVFLVDPSIAPVASSSNITSPWGNVNDLYRIATVRIDTVWHTYTASFDTISGIKRVAFFWFNQNTSSYDAMLEPAAVDNIVIDYSACPRPVATTVTAMGSTSANLSWVGPAVANYEVIYRKTSQGPADNIFLQ
ncbi:MAG: fibronectin type III domain-containing protein, partial [Bacteroidales bacterium]|nr:fibronectin type III domain-containing protein [Bacteroidales bacterium]